MVVFQQNFLLDTGRKQIRGTIPQSHPLQLLFSSPLFKSLQFTTSSYIATKILVAGLQFVIVIIASLLESFFVSQSIAKIYKPLSIVSLASQKSLTIFFNILEMLKPPKMHMKIVFKSNTHQSHYLFLFKISFVTGKQETLTNKNVLIIPKNKFKEVQKETHNNKWGFGALCICNKEPRFLPPCIPPRSAKSLMKIVQKFQL